MNLSMEKKKLYKNIKNAKIFGVCAGFAEYFNMDVTIMRIIWVVLGLCTSLGILPYLICALIMPDKPDEYTINI